MKETSDMIRAVVECNPLLILRPDADVEQNAKQDVKILHFDELEISRKVIASLLQ